jgi:sulfide:quinone oxidoreductase
MAKKLVIIGWGFWGLRTFYNLAWNKNFDITLIDVRTTSSMKPAMPEVAFEGKAVEKTRFDLRSVIEGKWATFLNEEVSKIDAENNKLTTKEGSEISYDYLVITAGAKKNFAAIKGLEENGYSMCDDIHAPKLWNALENFKWGKITIGSAKSSWGTRVEIPNWVAPCEGPIGEAMFMIDHYLRAKGLREKTEINVFTPGDIFFEDIDDNVRGAVGGLMGKKGLNLLTEKVTVEVTDKSIKFEDGSEQESDLTIMIPVYFGQKFLMDSGLSDEVGLLPTDKSMRHLDHKNIFGAGDLNAITMPKLGHLAVMQADIVTAQLLNEVWADVKVPEYKPEILCIMNMGGTEAGIVRSDTKFGGTHDIVWHGNWQGLTKSSFDLYNIMTKGKMPPKIGEHMMKWGIDKFGYWVK